jgi:subtilisin family serine protease
MRQKILQIRGLLPITFAIFTLLSTPAKAQDPSKDNFANGEILVKFSDGANSRYAADANRAVGTVVLDKFEFIGWQRVKLPKGISVKEAIARYEHLDGVEQAQPNFYYRLQATPNDPQFSNPGLYGLGKISAPAAWDLTTGGAAIVVANIDTGMRMTHEDLAANIWVNTGEIAGNGIDDDANGFIDDVNGWDFFFNDANPTDEHGHGTHTGGTIGAVGNNLLGVVGVNWTVKIMPIKIYSNTGGGSTSAMIINAYNYVRMMKNRGINIRVTNNSYGGCDEACGYDQATKDAIDALGDVNVLQVFAAGNSGVNTDITPFYPAAYNSPSVISVGGSNQNDDRIFNFGANTVDLAAPGLGILSTTFGSNSTYGTMSGTSMSTPHTAGAAALLAAFNPDLSAASLKATLMNTVDVLPTFNGFNKTGGRLNVDRALRNPTTCTFSPAANTVSVPTKGGVFTLGVAAGANCDYSVRSNVPWVKVLSSETMSGNATVTFRVTANPTITRSTTIIVGGQPVTVRQSRIG